MKSSLPSKLQADVAVSAFVSADVAEPFSKWLTATNGSFEMIVGGIEAIATDSSKVNTNATKLHKMLHEMVEDTWLEIAGDNEPVKSACRSLRSMYTSLVSGVLRAQVNTSFKPFMDFAKQVEAFAASAQEHKGAVFDQLLQLAAPTGPLKDSVNQQSLEEGIGGSGIALAGDVVLLQPLLKRLGQTEVRLHGGNDMICVVMSPCFVRMMLSLHQLQLKGSSDSKSDVATDVEALEASMEEILEEDDDIFAAGGAAQAKAKTKEELNSALPDLIACAAAIKHANCNREKLEKAVASLVNVTFLTELMEKCFKVLEDRCRAAESRAKAFLEDAKSTFQLYLTALATQPQVNVEAELALLDGAGKALPPEDLHRYARVCGETESG